MHRPSFFRRSELAATLWLLRREFAVCTVFTAVVNLLLLTPSLYMLQVFDRVLASQSELTLLALTLVMLFLFLALAFAEWSRSRLLVRTGVKMDEQINTRLFTASFVSHLEQEGGNASQAFADLSQLRQFLTGPGLFAFLDAPWAPIYTLVLFLLHPWLGWLSLLFTVVLVAVAWLSHRLTHLPVERAQAAGLEVGAYLQAKLRNAETMEAMGMLGGLRRRYLGRHRRYLALNHRAQDLVLRLQGSSRFLRYAQQSLALGAGALLVIEGELTPGAMVAANLLVGRATQPVDALVSSWKAFLAARLAFLRIETLLQRHPATRARAMPARPRGEVRLERLSATAPGRTEPILKDLNAVFPAGAVIGVIGPSGSGKSTLARALIGVWPWSEGGVLLDGQTITGWRREELGPYLGYLPQDVELFAGSIAENIARFGRIDSDKVIAAAQAAGMHEMILRFAQGYDTPIGEAGQALSGGQRQRIALARALYGEPSLVVLDEPNANLDDAGEAALLRAIAELKRRGKTVFLISHRLNIIGSVDRLLLLRDGRIEHYGPAQEVMATMRSASVAPVVSARLAADLSQ